MHHLLRIALIAFVGCREAPPAPEVTTPGPISTTGTETELAGGCVVRFRTPVEINVRVANEEFAITAESASARPSDNARMLRIVHERAIRFSGEQLLTQLPLRLPAAIELPGVSLPAGLPITRLQSDGVARVALGDLGRTPVEVRAGPVNCADLAGNAIADALEPAPETELVESSAPLEVAAAPGETPQLTLWPLRRVLHVQRDREEDGWAHIIASFASGARVEGWVNTPLQNATPPPPARGLLRLAARESRAERATGIAATLHADARIRTSANGAVWATAVAQTEVRIHPTPEGEWYALTEIPGVRGIATPPPRGVISRWIGGIPARTGWRFRAWVHRGDLDLE
ncbi:MAG: hypothetical protein AAGE52_26665 [Myxococcota bacterium]